MSSSGALRRVYRSGAESRGKNLKLSSRQPYGGLAPS